jgi:hypothetical protein
MDVEVAAAAGALAEAAEGPLDLLVVLATEDELAAHGQQLEAIGKACKGVCLWHELGSA